MVLPIENTLRQQQWPNSLIKSPGILLENEITSLKKLMDNPKDQ